MAYVYDKISDEVSELDTPLSYPAYWGPLYLNSPSGNYAAGYYSSNTTSTAYVVDTSVRPPVREWKDDLHLLTVPGWEIDVYPTPLALDDEGSLWADSANDDGVIIEYPVDTHTPTEAFTFTNPDGFTNGLSAIQIYTPTTSGGDVKVIIVPGGTIGHNNPHVLVGTKGTPGLTDYETDGTWVVWDAFLDDNDDVWVAGARPASLGGLSNFMKCWRLTDVTGTSTYDDLLTFTMPATKRLPRGFFKGGYYIGVWGDTDADGDWLFRANLTTGALTTRDISSNPVFVGGGGYRMTVPQDPSRFYFLNNDSGKRTLREINATDLSDGAAYNLSAWVADDGPLTGEDPTDSTVAYPLFLEGEHAFAGVRHFDINSDDNQGDFFLYYFDDDGSGGSSSGSPASVHAQILRRR